MGLEGDLGPQKSDETTNDLYLVSLSAEVAVLGYAVYKALDYFSHNFSYLLDWHNYFSY